MTISKEEQHDYPILVDEILHETRVSYEEYLYKYGRQIDRQRWKPVKRREQVEVFREREGYEQPKFAPIDADHHLDFEIGPMASMAANSSMPLMVAVGTVPGTLDDAMYGTLVDDTASLRVRTSYDSDRLEDCAVLASLKTPTEDDPYRFVGVKWFLRDMPGLNAVVRRRDFLMLTSSGLSTTSRGERIGYYILHSIHHKDFPEFTQQSIVRGQVSLCLLFRQLDDHSVDVYMQVLLDPCGNVMNFLVIQEFAQTLITVSHITSCAHKRKLFWNMRHRHRRTAGTAGMHAMAMRKEPADACSACSAPLGKLFSGCSYMCQLCQETVCSKCCVSKRITIDASAFGVIQKPLDFCLGCMVKTRQQSAFAIAREEMREKQRLKQQRLARPLRSCSAGTVLSSGSTGSSSSFSSVSSSGSTQSRTNRSRFGSTTFV